MWPQSSFVWTFIVNSLIPFSLFFGCLLCFMEPPFLSSRTGLTISSPVLPLSDANVCNRSRKRLQPPLQTFATAPANVCGKSLHLASVPASTCNRPRKYVQPSLQVRASEIGLISPCFFYRSTLISISPSLCCLEGSTNTRCLTITPLPGGQYLE